MTYNIALEIEQQQRIQNDLVASRFEYEDSYSKADAAVEAQIEQESDLYYHGNFDGATGGKTEKSLWGNLSYRNGWLAGVGEYYDKQYQTTFAEVF